MTATNRPQVLMTIEELAEFTGIARPDIVRRMAEGEIKADLTGVGGRKLFHRSRAIVLKASSNK